MIGGLARFDGQPVMVVGQHRGRGTRESYNCFGMCNLKTIVNHNVYWTWLSVLTYLCLPLSIPWVPIPGVGAEERGQAEAIAVQFGTTFQFESTCDCYCAW